jgi:hypothetical protein
MRAQPDAGDFRTERLDRWLTRDESARPPLDLLRPLPAEEMKATKVGKDVGNVKNNSGVLALASIFCFSSRLQRRQTSGSRLFPAYDAEKVL